MPKKTSESPRFELRFFTPVLKKQAEEAARQAGMPSLNVYINLCVQKENEKILKESKPCKVPKS